MGPLHLLLLRQPVWQTTNFPRCPSSQINATFSLLGLGPYTTMKCMRNPFLRKPLQQYAPGKCSDQTIEVNFCFFYVHSVIPIFL